MDAVDRELISLLRKDARTSVAILARKLGVSRGTVSNRITKLEDAGVIVGYTVRLRPDAQPNEIRAWMGVAVEGNETRSVIASLLGEP
ncbi:MAG: Lrp/AsnC family transcriptional regulator, partial [Betaproteobacteria bacterium]